MSRYLLLCFSIGIILAAGSGCQSPKPEGPDVNVDLTLDPSPPVVGDSEISLVVTDANGEPFEGATIRVEGNMNHAGMKPSFADLKEVEPGRYVGTIDFTMGGDWFLLTRITPPDGNTFEHKIDVPGVNSP